MTTPAVAQEELLNVTVDGVGMQVPKGTLIIRAAEMIGVAVPRFCDHPLLAPAANCRMCLIEIEGQPKPQPACAVTLAEGMAVRTQHTSEMARQAQTGTMEFLLINHPLDCPICDKGGECPLQNQAMSNGRGESRFGGPKRTFVKPINVSAQILLDRERCISCARCTRFADEVAGDPFIALLERGSQQQVGVGPDQPFDSYFSGNTIQICPVGALTSERYRFRSRPFDLVSTPTVCEHCAAGCALRTDVRRGTVLRRQAGDDPRVNEEWSCDKGRFGFGYLELDRLTTPLVRDEDSGELVPTSWPEALSIAARGLAAAGSRTTVLTGGRLTYENAYAYSKFARTVLGTDDVDFRSRPSSEEETQFLSAVVAGRPLGPTYDDLAAAPVVVLVGLEPEDEAPIVFLRLRKAVSESALRVFSAAPYESRGLNKLRGRLLPTVPGDEPALLESLTSGTGDDAVRAAAELLRTPGAVVLVGERLAQTPGALSAAARLADATGARLAWVPRRAGDRGALEAGLLPGLLPGGRTLLDASARTELAALWGVDPRVLPAEPGHDLPGMIAAVAADVEAIAAAADPSRVQRAVAAVLVAGVEAADVADHDEFLGALGAVPFLVSLEQRPSEISERADVVLPVAVVTEQAGSYVDWEGRRRPFTTVLPDTTSLTDARVLALLADEMVPYFGARARLSGGPGFGRGDVTSLAVELAALPSWQGEHAAAPSVAAGSASRPGAGQAVLATWRPLLDDGALQEGDPFLAASARPVVARVSPETAAGAGVSDGELLTLATEAGSLTFPVRITPMPSGVVWVPTRSDGRSVRRTLGAGSGALVRLSTGGAA